MSTESLIHLETGLLYGTMALYFASMACFFLFFALKKDKMGTAGKYLFAVAFLLHTLTLAARGLAAGRLPLTNQYEFASSFAWGISLCFLIFLLRFRFLAMGVIVAPVVFLIIGYAAMQNREIRELMPALKSGWLAFHVLTAVISYGAFGVSFAVSILYLLRGRMKDTEFWQRNMPEEEKLDMISYRTVSLGFLFLTFVIITGAIWAEQAWGSYWSWDPKETWALITWIIYAIYLHLRLSRGWRGKAAALFAVIGFICVIFTYIGVNTFLPGIHSYA